MLIADAHCHLAALKGPTAQRLALAAITPADIQQLANFRNANPSVKIGLGLHPWYLEQVSDLKQFTSNLRNLIESYRPDFIGETGLDKLRPNFELQLAVCKIHLELACDYNLAVVLHCVRAYNELLHLLTQIRPPRGLIHAFNANPQQAKELWRKNMYIGIGSLIYRQSSQLRRNAALLSSEQIVIESDAPYMPPPGHNLAQPEDCIQHVTELASLRQMPATELASIVNQNWERLYGFEFSS